MHRRNKFAVLGITASLVAGLAIAPGVGTAKPTASAAKSGKFKIKTKDNVKGTVATGKVISSSFGKGTYTGTILPPVIKLKFKFKGGTISMSAKDSHIEGANFVNTFTAKGTGKFKKLKLKGKGKSIGSIQAATSSFTFTGSY